MTNRRVVALLALAVSAVLLTGCPEAVPGPNRAPVAVAGADQLVLPDDPVELNGGGSYDPDGDTLTFTWRILARPASSAAGIVPGDAGLASFVADETGVYLVGLTVSDGELMSERDVLQVRAMSRPCTSDPDCPDDGEFCNGRATCRDGFCAHEVTDCSDGDPCTDDVCNEQLDRCDHPLVTDPPGEESLDAPGTCTDGIDNDCDRALDSDDPGCVTCSGDGECDDGNACTADRCDNSRCVSTPVADGAGCDDDQFCTEMDSCSSGVCGGSPRDCSAADGPCATGTCDDLADRCVGAPVADGTSCDDGRWCTLDDVCTAGACDGAARDCSGEAAECVAGVCNEVMDRCEGQPMTDGSLCDDGQFCTQNERCASGSCGGGQARDCSASGGGCTDGVCDEVADACVGDPLPSGSPCDDGVFCTVSDACDGAGTCEGAARDCSLLDSQCALGTCDEGALACIAVPANDGQACDDGLFCNDNETCQGGSCTGGIAHSCDDLDTCTEDTCDEANDTCTYVLVPIPGAEGQGVAGTCDDGVDNDCDGFTDIADSQCQECQNDIECNDGLPCTADSCVGSLCVNTIVPDGTVCDDLLFCTDADQCTQGICTGTPHDCSHLDDACNLGLCNEVSDLCFAQPINQGDGCDDGLFCTVATTCSAGVCGGGQARDCSALDDDCNLGACNEGADLCEPQPANNGQPCNDGVFCNVGETCQAGACQGGGSRDCSAATDQCNDGRCDEPSTSCVPEPQPGQECQDGQFCTAGDICDDAGACSPGAGTPCQNECRSICDEIGNACDPDGAGTPCGDPADTTCDDPDTCDGAGACAANHLPSGAPCGDQGVTCRVDDACDGGGGCTDNGLEPPGTPCGSSNDTECDNQDTCAPDGACQPNFEPSGAPCGTQGAECQVDDTCDGSGECTDNGNESAGTSCDDGDLCTGGDTCDGDGTCDPGPDPRDGDGDSYEDSACGGDDCDDLDPLVNPGASEGPVCDPGRTCGDFKDNDCDGSTDGSDGDCSAVDFICVFGPGVDVTTGPPGDTLTVVLDGPGYDPGQIVCVTDNARLTPADVLFENNFEAHVGGFVSSGASLVYRTSSAQNPDSPGSWGLAVCNDSWIITDPIDTTGRSRIQVRWASDVSWWSMDANEYFVTEYSPDGGTSWYPLEIQGDEFRESYQWFTHILPPRAEGVTNLRIAWSQYIANIDDECGRIDDVVVSDLPDPTVSWTLLANHFEPAEGNSTADDCSSETIALFTSQGDNDDEICLRTDAQYAQSAGTQGVRLEDDDPTWLRDPDVDTTYVPAGSDLISGFAMQELNLPYHGYAGAFYDYDGTWRRMGGVGLFTTQNYDWFRFVWDQNGIGVPDAQVEFRIPGAADANSNQGIYVDDYELSWHRASYDAIGVFTDQGDGSYIADIQSTLEGTANVTCIFYGGTPPLVTDGTGDNSDSAPVTFVP